MNKIYLDLEGTVIKDWENPVLINCDRVGSFLRSIGHTEVGIFSFAMWDENDVRTFEHSIKPELETALQVRINEYPTRSQIMTMVRNISGLSIDDNELSLIFGKEKPFEDWIVVQRDVDTAWLIDDMVQERVVHNISQNKTIIFMNVNRM